MADTTKQLTLGQQWELDAKQTIDFLEGLNTLRPSFDEIAEAIEPPRG